MHPASVYWDHEKSLLLISKFKRHEALWNPNNKAFHDTKKKEEGWWAIAEEMKVPAAELKKKIECLRGSYRRERSKVRLSRGKEEEYHPKWFGYKSLAFLEETSPQGLSDNEHLGDPEDPKIISPSMQYVLNEKREYSNIESFISPKKKKFCNTNTTVQYRPTFEYNKQKPPFVIEQMKKGIVSDSSNIADPMETVTKSTFKDGTRFPDMMKEGIMSEGGAFGMSEFLKTEMADRSTGIGHLIDETSKNEKVTSELPIITRGKFKPMRPKPVFEREQPLSDTRTKDDLLGTSNSNSSSKDVAEPNKVESTEMGSINHKKRRKGENTTSNPPVLNGNESKFPKDVNNMRERFPRNSKPVQSQEIHELDECTVFGQLVESTLRNLPGAYRVEAKMKLSQVLWEIELEALKQNPLSGSYIGLPKLSPS